ncbi:MAG TPA: 5-oxoprolinase subunit PxpB [Thermoanaerobaculia bacterium]|nr:5-oxoprolinase subunit PxpB [Thermoanaerobaculia bacterium]
MTALKIETRDVSEGSLLVEFPEAPDAEANRTAVELAARLTARPGRELFDVIPGARTLYLSFDPRMIGREALLRRVRRAADEPPAISSESRVFRIPVAYGGENGPDLATLAWDRGIDPEEFARRHEGAEYRVAFLGFSPGFAYLTGLPAELATPRRDTPRPRVPEGSVAIGGPYTAVYPTESPGGWRLIGRSSVRLFDPLASPPALLRAGDRVRFERITDHELARRIAAARHPAPAAVLDGEPVFAAVAPGLFTSVQGGPRHGLGAWGVPAGGAMDAATLRRGNAIVGNPPEAAALEVTLSGPELRVLDDAVACVAGGDFQVRCNGKLLELDTPFEVKAGDHLAFGYARRGARAYLCVRAGLVERRPGEPLKRLARGDVVARGRAAERVYATHPRMQDAGGNGVRILRVLAGPQSAIFPAAATDVFFSATYRVSPESDRRGIRLDGPAVELRRPSDIPPEGTALGAIQVPAAGLPIVLGPDRPVTGGYAKIATVIRRDWPLLAQAPPGTAVRFRAVTLAEAIEVLEESLD